MGTVIDDNNPNVDPENEVRKLQDLVKHLEYQNQILRNKTEVVTDDEIGVDTSDDQESSNHSATSIVNNNTRVTSVVNDERVKSKESKDVQSLNDIDVIDLEYSMKEECEDSWLYKSPEKSSVNEKVKSSPYDWMRQDLVEASPKVASVKRSLVFKLSEAVRVGRSPSSGAPSLTSSPVASPVSNQNYSRSVVSPQRNSEDHVEASQSQFKKLSLSSSSNMNGEEVMPKIRKPLKGLDDVMDKTNSSRINTNTFRKKKSAYIGTAEVDERAAGESQEVESVRRSPQLVAPHSPRPTPDRDLGVAASLSRNSSLENASDSPRGSDYKLTDVVDVRVLAQMQEDNLRQSMNSPKIQRKTITKSRPMNDTCGNGSSRSSPGRYLESDNGYQSMGRSNASLGSLSSNSDSPANSPYSSQYLESHQAVDGHRRSLPNLAKETKLSLHTVPSDPQLNDAKGPPRRTSASQQSPRHGVAGARYQNTVPPRRGSAPQQQTNTPQRAALNRTVTRQQQYLSSSVNSGQRLASSGDESPAQQRSLRSTYRVSPHRTLSPQGGAADSVSDPRNKSPQRSGIPRPGSASKLPGPRKTSIPSARRAALFNRNATEDNWKDGCF